MTKEMQVEVVPRAKKQATITKLILGLFLDAVGMLSYAVPLLAEATDVIWAPIAAFAMTMLYKGTVGKVSGVITFIEEIIPGLDFIPTFTLTWLYEYYLDKKNNV